MSEPARLLVVKFGTANLCDESGQLAQSIFADFAKQMAELLKKNIKIIIVSSGAIKAGNERLANLKISPVLLDRKETAGIGARHLLDRWGKAFADQGREIAQVWVTFANWQSSGERRSIKSSILDYLHHGIIPVVNENDVVSDREIVLMNRGISENDRLARMIAFLMGADSVLFLTDEGGVYEKDPKTDPQARLYAEINAWARPESIGISRDTSKVGTGGMIKKWQEASLCAKKGMRVAIAGKEDEVILKFAKGELVGTIVGKSTKLR